MQALTRRNEIAGREAGVADEIFRLDKGDRS